MKLVRTKLSGSYIVELEKIEDDRGFFARTWCEEVFLKKGLISKIVQANLSYNHKAGTLRGMHYQRSPHGEVKIVRCIRGAIFDVIVDLRPDSKTYLKWFGTELSAENYKSLYIPVNFAHGFQTLTDDAEIFYLVSQYYHPESSTGLRYDDPAIGISWPLGVTEISGKDSSWPDIMTP
ncbi:MAG: dTDP-4-dehydrorhamnose 3,5-epimerase [Fidelibacterota bacterium]